MLIALLLLISVGIISLLVMALILLRRTGIAADSPAAFGGRLDSLERSLQTGQADVATRLEASKGDLRQHVSDRLNEGFNLTRSVIEQHLAQGRGEIAQSLALTTSQLKTEFEGLRQKTEQNLDLIRAQVDQKLLAISDQVQQKLTENMKEGFAQFERVQQHLKTAEEQLRAVSTIGNSINDLNNLLKLPHLRGTFGEASLERLLADFLPAHMFELQCPVAGGGRVDAMIKFPNRGLPVDAKFPREQVLPLFETNDEAELAEARVQLLRVLKSEARRIAEYVKPEHGTMDIALMYLPSETLYLEAIRSIEITSALSQLRVFPVSPNTLLMTLQAISLAYKWYEVAAQFEETRKELAKAQTSLGHFQRQFETIGKSLEKAQEAYDTASRHLKTYRGRVTGITGEEVPEADGSAQLLLAKAKAEASGS